MKGRKLGEVVAIKDGALVVHGQGGFIEIARARPEGGRKGVAADAGVREPTADARLRLRHFKASIDEPEP